eukprot:jgi/Botrbrau1/8526/Bobra.0029s0030.1
MLHVLVPPGEGDSTLSLPSGWETGNKSSSWRFRMVGSLALPAKFHNVSCAAFQSQLIQLILIQLIRIQQVLIQLILVQLILIQLIPVQVIQPSSSFSICS